MKTFPTVIEVLKSDLSRGTSINQIVKKTGLTHNTIGSYLEGRAEPTQESLEKLAKTYHCTVAYLRGDTDNPHRPADSSAELIDLSSLTSDQRQAWDMISTLPNTTVRSLLDLLSQLKIADSAK